MHSMYLSPSSHTHMGPCGPATVLACLIELSLRDGVNQVEFSFRKVRVHIKGMNTRCVEFIQHGRKQRGNTRVHPVTPHHVANKAAIANFTTPPPTLQARDPSALFPHVPRDAGDSWCTRGDVGHN